MFSLEVIHRMNREACERARELELEPWLVESQAEIDRMPPFPFPNIGDLRPDGWKLVDTLFCDSLGFGAPDEPALTAEQLKDRLEIGKGYAIVEEGQFQLVLGVFEQC